MTLVISDGMSKSAALAVSPACPCCGLDLTAPELDAAVKKLWERVGPLRITSGTRCPSHNRAVGGVPRSRHLRGRAVDVAADSGLLRAICRAAEECGFNQILPYQGKGYVHLGV
ncbi:YcbK family protein [Jonquetella sp. BV3C21]|uniref:YcbK family protein n=1 Tax=Jonquetella sp. BV3C21 TaxID=1111126 RepID=UPI0003ADC41A|nr:D-Ala-D-Ala carboxypeptidase family metallohydrolase [Jonquetella sp. BV3C21]ERL23601.1 peptidase M15 [Jonquetella sp. BV3C21]